ncbi:MAG: hypothetical protein GF421_07745 [Candidatus Aminicenantes bacterium]|nr:hypothetical protein [Candidatus Aminicenantes bacterium]
MNEFEEIRKSKGKKFLFFLEKSPYERDYVKYEQLRMDIWGDPNDYLSNPRNMAAENYFNEGSSLFMGIYTQDEKGKIQQDPDHFIGFAYGYVGVQDKNTAYQNAGNLNFYSQYAAIKKEYRNLSLGIRLKEFQRKIVRTVLSIDSMTCTYDPLTGVNAYRNIHKLGMDVLSYKPSFYKEFSGFLNRPDIPADRFYVMWKLSQRSKNRDFDFKKALSSGDLVINSHLEKIKGKNRNAFIEVSHKVDEEMLRSSKKVLLVEIPYDFYNMIRLTNVVEERIRKIPLDWRLRTRTAFIELFKAGYQVADFRCHITDRRKRDFYVLEKKANAEVSHQDTA